MKQIKFLDLQKINSLPLAIGVNTLLFALIFTFFTPHFPTNDDVAMLLKVSGLLNGVVDSELIFSSSIIGKFLTLLYSSFNWYWYESYMVFALFVSYTALLELLINSGINRVFSIILFVIFFILVGAFTIIILQFTIVAMIVSVIGIVLIQQYEKTGKLTQLVSGIILAFLGSLIRIESFYFAFFISMSIYCVRIITKDATFVKTVKSKSLWISVFVFLTSSTISKIETNNSDIRELAGLGQNIMEYSILKNISEKEKTNILNTAGWSANDYNMMRNWFFVDTMVYSKDNYKKILSKLPPKAGENYRDGLKWIKNLILKDKLIWLVLGMGVFIIISFADKYKSLIACFVLTATALVLLVISFIWFKAPPFRVYFPAFASVLIVALSYLAYNKTSIRVAKDKLILAILIPALFYGGYKALKTQDRISEHKKQNYETFATQMKSINDGYIHINWGTSIPWESLLPFQNQEFVKNIRLINIWGDSLSEYMKKTLNKYDIHDIYMEIIQNKKVIVHGLSKEKINMFKIYISEHYGKEIMTSDVGKSPYILQFKEVKQ